MSQFYGDSAACFVLFSLFFSDPRCLMTLHRFPAISLLEKLYNQSCLFASFWSRGKRNQIRSWLWQRAQKGFVFWWNDCRICVFRHALPDLGMIPSVCLCNSALSFSGDESPVPFHTTSCNLPRFILGFERKTNPQQWLKRQKIPLNECLYRFFFFPIFFLRISKINGSSDFFF